jgi:hypothetical protein
MMSQSKLGRNPLNKKRASPVSRIIESDHKNDDVDASPPEVIIRESRDLYSRLKQMEIELNWSQVLGRLYRRIRRPPV